jgi:hypothetical protein
MDSETKAAFEQVTKRLTEMEERLAERIHDTETKLLKAFHGWASATDAKLRSFSDL